LIEYFIQRLFLSGGQEKMNFAKIMQKYGFILVCVFVLEMGLFAQEAFPQAPQQPANTDTKTVLISTEGKQVKPPKAGETKQADAVAVTSTQNKKSDPDRNLRQQQLSEEEAAILPYFNNYLEKYVLGPEDIISVEVFGQPSYSKGGIVVPPTSRISYPLIPGGVFVGGKTTEQISEDIKKKLDEFIIDPQVTVTLDKVGSARFSVLGKVNTPGIKVMNRRYNVYEAVSEAGGLSKDADKKRVILMRLNPLGGFTQTIIDFDKLLGGKAEVPYLIPGDQIIVPEKKWSVSKILDIVGKASALRILFGVPF
jgi:polysaccharide export outer membrane protein